VRVLAKELNIDLVEWGEGVEERSLGGGFGEATLQAVAQPRISSPFSDRESSMSKLASFMSRQSFTPLNLGGTDSHSRPRMLLLTSLPNLSHEPTRDNFHALLKHFCKSYSPSSIPMIIIHSDAGSSGTAEISWMERDRSRGDSVLKIVGRDIKEGPWCQEIE
jgi:cell cycle checkpoint protein